MTNVLLYIFLALLTIAAVGFAWLFVLIVRALYRSCKWR